VAFAQYVEHLAATSATGKRKMRVMAELAAGQIEAGERYKRNATRAAA
jgi:hypothetical protein